MTCFYTLNCRGLGNHLKLLGILVDLNKPKHGGKLHHDYVIALQETKLYVLSSKHKAILTSYNLNYLIQPCSQNNSGGLLLLFPNKWKIQNFYQSHMALALKESESGSIYCSIYINPLSKDYSVLTGLANKLAEQRRDTLGERYIGREIQRRDTLRYILVGGDFNCRSSSELCNLA